MAAAVPGCIQQCAVVPVWYCIGLLFAPTTIFAMTWGVAFFGQDRGMNNNAAVIACAMVPLGWTVGCLLLGWVADRIGKRKPVLVGGALMMIATFAQLLVLPSLWLPAFSMFLFGVASGVAMIPYSIIKEANPDEVKGSATGAINFITFGVTAFIGPLFVGVFGRNLSLNTSEAHFRQSGAFWIGCVALALMLSLLLKETGSRTIRSAPLSSP